MPTLFPIVRLQIIGSEHVDLNVPPDYIKSMTHEVVSVGAGNRITVELFDPSWSLMDLFLSKAKEALGGLLKFRIQYGLHNDLSPVYIMGVMKVNPGTLSLLGVEISIEGIDEGVVVEFSKKVPKRVSKKVGSLVHKGRVSEIVEKIAKSKGWDHDIVTTNPIFEYVGKKKGREERIWVQGRMTDLEFIKYLGRFAISRRHPGTYYVRLETIEKAGSVKHKLTFAPSKSLSLYKRYVFMHDQMGDVISFEPEIDSLGPVLAGASGIKVMGRDKATRKMSSIEVNAKSHISSVFLGSKVLIPPGAVSRHIMLSTSNKQLEDALESYYGLLSTFIFKATMTVIGDHRIRPLDLISVMVQTPLGNRYFTSGTWRIQTVEHEISQGQFETKLTMFRNASDIGNVTPGGPRIQLRMVQNMDLSEIGDLESSLEEVD